MAKLEKTLNGNFQDLLSRIEKGIVNSSATATLEAESDFSNSGARCSVRVFERYSMFGGNRVSLSVTLFQGGIDAPIMLSAVTSGGSQAMFFKVNTFGEEAFLQIIEGLLDAR